MKKVESKKILLILLIIVSVVALVLAYLLAREMNRKNEADFSRFFNHHSFSDDVFADIQQIEKEMDQAFESHQKVMKQMFKNAHSSFKNHASSSSNLISVTTDKSYEYSLSFSGVKKENVVVGVSNGILVISAKEEKSSNAKSQQTSFYYSLALPSDAVGEPELTREDGKVLIKFSRAGVKS